MNDEVRESELHAYIDGMLAPERIPQVESWLDRNPDAAARVAAYARQRQDIRRYLGAGATTAGEIQTRLQRKLFSRLRQRSYGRLLRGAIAATLLVTTGWIAHGALARVQSIIVRPESTVIADEAADAYAAAAGLRATMPEMLTRKPQQLATLAKRITGRGIRLPQSPDERHVLAGGMIVPWDRGAALELVYVGARNTVVTVLIGTARRPSPSVHPHAVAVHGITIVYWTGGHVAYAVGGTLPADALMEFARQLGRESGSFG